MALSIETKFSTMKKNILLFTSVSFLLIIFFACYNNPVNTAGTTTKPDSSAAAKDTAARDQTAVLYTCKMHPEVTSDKPGKCPKCGMDLVKKEIVVKDSATKDLHMDSTKH
jgi:Cu(I)/Ag(I) efflux system membrane fusion protein